MKSPTELRQSVVGKGVFIGKKERRELALRRM